MNKTKRGFELAGAIISIVISAFMILGCIFLLASYDFLLSILAQSDLTEEQVFAMSTTINAILVIFMFIFIVILILSIILCVPPTVINGQYKSRFGVSLTLTIILGIIALIELAGAAILEFIILAVPLAFIIVSMCLKHNVVYDTSNITSIYHYNNQKVDNNESQDNQNQ